MKQLLLPLCVATAVATTVKFSVTVSGSSMPTLPLWIDVLASVVPLTGSAFVVIGSFELAKLGDFYKHRHGPTKAVTLDVGCLLIASIFVFSFGTGSVSLHELQITPFV